MSYAYSTTDKKNLKWFENVNERQSLVGVRLVEGNMRGLSPFSLDFSYPITAIAGANGSGKSTILALVACAFHNKKNGYRLPDRRQSYYTFSDFFIQSAGELSPEGVWIAYRIRHNRWRNKPKGVEQQIRRKPHGGKWSNYNSRVDRNVIYFGMQRVVPYYERTNHKSNRSRFKAGSMLPDMSRRIATLAGKILGKTYASFEGHEYSKYWLPKAQVGELKYSGFNMGAGESAVFEILSTIFLAGEGCLLVIDEIELGLHEHAQKRFIDVLKELCEELKCQIICTTHSYQIFKTLPPEGRVFIQSISGKTQVNPGISAEYACGKMGRDTSHELDILVEDDVARAIVEASLDHDLRSRCHIQEVGSHGSIKRVMATRYIENRRNCLCLLDGDQRTASEGNANAIANYCDGRFNQEREEVRAWAASHLDYMPGNDWPEKWLFDQAIENFETLKTSAAETWRLSNENELREFLERAVAAGKHNEFHTLATKLSLPEETVRRELTAALRRSSPEEFEKLADRVRKQLA
jgi:predicted ATPase